MTAAIGTAAAAADTVQAAAKHRKLQDAAQQFEAMFLQQMMRPMHWMGGEDGEEATGASGSVESMGTESMARAIAGAGGLGIAAQVLAQVERQAAGHEAKNISAQR